MGKVLVKVKASNKLNFLNSNREAREENDNFLSFSSSNFYSTSGIKEL